MIYLFRAPILYPPLPSSSQTLSQTPKNQQYFGPITPPRYATNESTIQYLLCNCFKSKKDDTQPTTNTTSNRGQAQTVSPSTYKPSAKAEVSSQRQTPSSSNQDLPQPKQLPTKSFSQLNKKTLYIDLDETLVNSSMSPIDNPDLIFPVKTVVRRMEGRPRRR